MDHIKVSYRRNREVKKRIHFEGIKSDSRLLLDAFSKDLLRELERRGYDLRTIKFKISKVREGETYTPLEDDCI